MYAVDLDVQVVLADVVVGGGVDVIGGGHGDGLGTVVRRDVIVAWLPVVFGSGSLLWFSLIVSVRSALGWVDRPAMTGLAGALHEGQRGGGHTCGEHLHGDIVVQLGGGEIRGGEIRLLVTAA